MLFAYWNILASEKRILNSLSSDRGQKALISLHLPHWFLLTPQSIWEVKKKSQNKKPNKSMFYKHIKHT